MHTALPVQSDWQIEGLVPGGEGMARLSDGRVGFVGGVAVGDCIRVEHVALHKGWVHADEWKLERPGAGRVSPACPWYGECGGCDWMHLSASAQCDGKAEIVVDALKRIGGISIEPPTVFAGECSQRYRRRLRLHIDGEGRIGLLARSSHRVVEIEDCLVARQELATELRGLRDWGQARRHLIAEFDTVEVRVADTVPQVGLFWHPRANPVSSQALAAVHQLCSSGRVVGVSGHRSSAFQTWRDAPQAEIEVPLGSFIQVNAEVNRALTQALVETCEAHGVASFLELYCGAGNLTLPLLASGLRGRAIELDQAAVRAARRAAQRQGLPGGTFHCGDAGSPALGGTETLDLVLLDPPRTGAAQAVPHVTRLRPKYVALCACDPPTLARDLRSLVAQGYELEQLSPFDMFPQTHHVEVLAWLSRSAR